MQQPPNPKTPKDDTAAFLHAVCEHKRKDSIEISIALSHGAPAAVGTYHKNTTLITSRNGKSYDTAQSFGFKENEAYHKSHNKDVDPRISVRGRVRIMPDNLSIDQYPFGKSHDAIRVSLAFPSLVELILIIYNIFGDDICEDSDYSLRL